jgi:hypothetical protein
MATKTIWSPRKWGMAHDFGKPMTKAFQKDGTSKPSMVIKTF